MIDGLITSVAAHVGGITNHIAREINLLSIHGSAAVGRRANGVAASTSLCSWCDQSNAREGEESSGKSSVEGFHG